MAAKKKAAKTARVKTKSPTAKRAIAPAPAAEVDPMLAYLSRGRSDGSVTYMLRCCRADLTSRGGFQWPESGPVEAPDWQPTTECGNGIHGWLMGNGDITSSDYHADVDAKWLVCAVWSGDVIDLGAKVKTPRAWVVYCGDAKAAADLLRARGADGVIKSTLTGGDGSTLTGGYGSTLTGGDGSTLTGGARSTLTGGDGSTLTGGYGSTLTGGYGSTLTGGDGSTLTGGENGEICALYWDGKRYRKVVAYCGEDGIEPSVAYRLDESGKWQRVETAK